MLSEKNERHRPKPGQQPLCLTNHAEKQKQRSGAPCAWVSCKENVDAEVSVANKGARFQVECVFLNASETHTPPYTTYHTVID